jgi:GWxTD domain-containing protein
VASLLILRLCGGLWVCRRLVRAGAPIEPGVFESGAISVPVTVGPIRPAILLPPDWRGWDAAKLEAVLAHEKAHVRRRDPARLALAHLYRSVCWFHPLAWWLYSHLADLAEAASDDAALATTNDSLLYAETLLDFFGRTPGRVRLEGVAMARRGSTSRRMDRILDSGRKLSSPVSVRMAAALAVAAVPFIYLSAAARPVWAAVPRVAQAGGQAENSHMCGGNAAYRAWLNEDVVFIIETAERKAFERLTTEEECGKFVEQFWLRRDPTPGTAENEFKTEHYRRIAYANERFGVAGSEGKPGWKTDRGRIYIQFGPPDEIESHPADGTRAPYEMWKYRHIDGIANNVIMEFVDEQKNGDYLMTKDASIKKGTYISPHDEQK